jgi:hypothetical protein
VPDEEVARDAAPVGQTWSVALATDIAPGIMSAADKAKLDALGAGSIV